MRVWIDRASGSAVASPREPNERACSRKLRGARRDLLLHADARTLKNGDHFTLTTLAGNLDLLGTPAGTGGYEPLARTATAMDVGGVTVLVAALEDLIAMKRAAGRPKDLIEIEILSTVL